MFCFNPNCKLPDRYHNGPCAVELKSETNTNINNTHTHYNQTYVVNYVTVNYNNFTGNTIPQNPQMITNPFEAFSQLTDKK